MDYPLEQVIKRYLHDLETAEELAIVEEHLKDCSECCRRVANFARALETAGPKGGEQQTSLEC
jgi:predicted anti-sigma-YlaC factor YlaD